MKRSIRDMKKPAHADLDAQAETLYQTYSGKSDAELMEALQNMSTEERMQLAAFERELAPMLSDAQRKKLSAIVRSLTNERAADSVQK